MPSYNPYVFVSVCLLQLASGDLKDFLRCHLCESKKPVGPISDCHCNYEAVNKAVTEHFVPVLGQITSSSFFRYFWVDLDRSCPFWQEDGSCMMEGCSVCTCDEKNEEGFPLTWLDQANRLAEARRLKVEEEETETMSDKVELAPSETSLNSENHRSAKTKADREGEYGWISSYSSGYGFRQGYGHDDSLGRVDHRTTRSSTSTSTSSSSSHDSNSFQQDTSVPVPVPVHVHASKGLSASMCDEKDWIDMVESNMVCRDNPSSQEEERQTKKKDKNMDKNKKKRVREEEAKREDRGAYINLLQNPERFTGYSGPSARRVWQSIQEENCFGGLDDQCFEKRTFYRLMSGLQASISTHIAKEYFYDDARGGRWGVNMPLFVRSVGSHPDRINNLYFTFLFLIRAVSKAGNILTKYPFYTGDTGRDSELMGLLTALTLTHFNSSGLSTSPSGQHDYGDVGLAVAQCRVGFDESVLFQVPGVSSSSSSRSTGYGYGDDIEELSHSSSPSGSGVTGYWSAVEEKRHLKEEFKHRFRNISRIMDCVTCERCRLWGKLQIMGLGTAIKILLTSDQELEEAEEAIYLHSHSQHQHGYNGKGGQPIPMSLLLTRQEVIALVNTLHQFSRSVEFAAQAQDLEIEHKIASVQTGITSIISLIAALLMVVYLANACLYSGRHRQGREQCHVQSPGKEED